MAVSPKALKRLAKKTRAEAVLEKIGGTLIRINWNKNTVHYLNNKHQKQVASL